MPKRMEENNQIQQKIFNKVERKNLYIGIFMAVILGIIVLVFLFSSARKDDKTAALAPKTDFFQGLSLEARAVFVWDIKEKKAVFEKDSDKVMPLASLAKLMTAVTAIEQLPKHAVITVNKNSLDAEGDVGILVGEKFNIGDLINLSLLTSSNDAVAAVSVAAGGVASGTNDKEIGHDEFIKLMNQKATDLGVTSMVFYNESGLDLNDKMGGAYGSARDVARLFEYTLENYPELVLPTKNENITIKSASSILHQASNTNPQIGKIPGILASKTGFTDIAGGNLAVVLDPSIGRPFIIVVLGSSYEGRFDDVVTLSQATLSYLKNN